MPVASVVLPIARDIEFDYLFYEKEKVFVGSRVLVDLSGRKAIGIVVAISPGSQVKRLKPISAILDDDPVLSERQIEFARELKKYYPYTLGEFVFMMLPALLKRSARIIYAGAIGADVSFEAKRSFIQGADFLSRYALWKDAVRSALEKNASVLVAFPQNTYLAAALPAMLKDFPDLVVLYGEDDQKKFFANWQRSRKKSLIVGTRMAFFNYPPDLGLIVVEDETNRSYFHEEKPFYHLADTARLLSEFKKIPLVLSSDFPSLTTYRGIIEGNTVFSGTDAAPGMSEVIGKGEYTKARLIGPLLVELLRKAITAKKRIAVVWNKKGVAFMLRCDVCGHILTCDSCSGYLRPQGQNSICPYCAKKYPSAYTCPQCHKGHIKPAGLGLERVAGLIKKNFPDVSISLADKNQKSQITLYTSAIISSLYAQKEYDMGVILDADSFLGYTDFNATFEAFLYLKKLKSLFKDKLYVFTNHPAHHLFTGLAGDWRKFYDAELGLRKNLNLPPFARVVKIIFRFDNADILLKNVEALYNKISAEGFEIYGPFEENPFKLRGKFRYSLTVKLRALDTVDGLFAQISAARGSRIKLAAIVSG
jgi:primosomal protein N' (replication factor Y)